MNIAEHLVVIHTIYQVLWTVEDLKDLFHGLTKFSMEDVPPNMFFLEYIARPQTAEIFFEDVLMACVFLRDAYTS